MNIQSLFTVFLLILPALLSAEDVPGYEAEYKTLPDGMERGSLRAVCSNFMEKII